MRVAVQLLFPVSATRLLGRVSAKEMGSRTCPTSLAAPSTPSSLGDSACAKPAETPAGLGSLHPLLCLHHIKGLRNAAAWLCIQSAGVPGTQRKLFSNFRWCLEGWEDKPGAFHEVPQAGFRCPSIEGSACPKEGAMLELWRLKNSGFLF